MRGLVERPGPFFCSSPRLQLSHGRTVQSYLLASGTYVLLRTQLSHGHAVGVPRPLKPSSSLAAPLLHFRGKEMHGNYLPCSFLLFSIVEHCKQLVYILIEARLFITRRSILFVIIKQVRYEIIPVMPYIIGH